MNRQVDVLVAMEVMGLSSEAAHCWPRTKDEAWSALQQGLLHAPLTMREDISGVSWPCDRVGCICSIYEGHPLPVCFASVPPYSGNLGDAWIVHNHMCHKKDRPFTTRKKYLDTLGLVINDRLRQEGNLGDGLAVPWPSLLSFLKPIDICLAALRSMDADIAVLEELV